METNNKKWNEKEWLEMREHLEALDVEDLKQISKNLGINFEGGVDSIKDRPGLSAKEQIILVLDEAPKDELIREYEKIKFK